MFKNMYKLNALNVTRKISSINEKIRDVAEQKAAAVKKAADKRIKATEHKLKVEKEAEAVYWERENARRDSKIQNDKMRSLMGSRYR